MALLLVPALMSAGRASEPVPQVVADEVDLSAEQVRFFESQIRPLLAERCFKCHGPDKQNGGLRLDARSGALHGGETGPAVVPGRPDESLLVEAIEYRSLEMPPSGRLPDDEIALLTGWIAAGAVWPDTGELPIRASSGELTDADRSYWAFQPPLAAEPPDVAESAAALRAAGVGYDDWSRGPIDQFVLATLRDAGLAPSPAADRITLLRRVHQDLTGLPPTPDDVDRFLSDETPEAYARVVDGLLASPRYGEHQARLWLDLVRYAESDGYKQDTYRPTAWRYRDYVIQSFNDDKPYDRFLAEQIAGDELEPDNPEARIATGFYRNGIYEYNQRDARGQWRDQLNDVTETFGDVFLAMSVGCARCHDHKFDPILQTDYYRLQAFFAGLSFYDGPFVSREDQRAHVEALQAWLDATADVRARIGEFTRDRYAGIEKAAIGKFSPDLQALWHRPVEERVPGDEQIIELLRLQVQEEINNFPKTLKGEALERWDALHAELAAFDSLKPQDLPATRLATEIGPAAPAVMVPDRPRLGPQPPGFLSVLDSAQADVVPLPQSPGTTGRRAALAQWLTSPEHPLTARIIVNRIWQMHFGRGLVATSSDFGRLSEPPTHPELLDALAVQLKDGGWRLKSLHREIVLSATYRQAGVAGQDAQSPRLRLASQVDPENRWLWRAPLRRLAAEQIRDAALLVSGELDLAAGGEGGDHAGVRRSIYTKVIRNRRDPLQDVFDYPERIASVAERHVTTTPTQALLMANGDWVAQRAERFASRIVRDVPGGDDSRVRRAYQLAYGRSPTAVELERAAAYLFEEGRQTDPEREEPAIPAALVDLCHVLLNSSEFVYID
ncbi:MAG: PSD1 domain-containing protein [Planctomyces sp.]|nr:PSD1 domain-containing protein [Planctomyces sp.]